MDIERAKQWAILIIGVVAFISCTLFFYVQALKFGLHFVGIGD